MRAAFQYLPHGLRTQAEVAAPISGAVVKIDRIFLHGLLNDNEVQTILEFKRPGYIRRND